MPTYQYSCTSCGHFFEQFQSFSDDALTECPECSGKLRKVFNAVGVVFKGSGFYRTDSRKGSDPAAASSSSDSSSKSDAGSKPDTGSKSDSSSTTSESSTKKADSPSSKPSTSASS